MNIRYEKEVEEDRIIIYRLDENGKLLEIAKIYPTDDPDEIKIVFDDAEGWYVGDDRGYIKDFGVNTFEELKNLDAKEFGNLIWGDDLN